MPNTYVPASMVRTKRREMPVVEGGEHKDAGKPAVQLLEAEFLLAIAEVMEFGARKYGARNYRKGIAWTRLYGSVLRHLLAWVQGHNKDPESNLPHLAHAGASLMMLMQMTTHRSDLDDR